MNRVLCLIVISVLFSSISLAGDLESEALQQAEQFVSQIDNQDYHAAYNATSELFQLSSSEREWISGREITVKILGPVHDRRLVSVKARDSYPGLPDGDYVIVYYEAQTEKKTKAAEVVLLSYIADNWQACKYSLK